jgi:hypothetical protein
LTTLLWSTATEVNNARFEIEKSTTGNEFRKIGSVFVKDGFSNQVKNYQLIDSSGSQSAYYRLSQFDNNGTKTTFKPIWIGVQNSGSLIVKTYPNPTKDLLQVDISGAGSNGGKVSVYNIHGELILTQEFFGSSDSLNLSLSKVPAGIYHLQIDSDSLKQITKVVKY